MKLKLGPKGVTVQPKKEIEAEQQRKQQRSPRPELMTKAHNNGLKPRGTMEVTDSVRNIGMSKSPSNMSN